MHKPVLVLRNVTERPEGLEAGTLRLGGNNEDEIFNQAQLILNDKEVYDSMANSKNPFGDGYAAERIVQAILYHFGFRKDRPADY